MKDDTHGLEVVPPHELPNQLRICYRGVLTMEEAQAKIGDDYRVLELCPAKCLARPDGDADDTEMTEATEVIFAKR